LANHLDANIHENYQDAQDPQGNYFANASQPIIHPDGYCRQRFGPIRAQADLTESRFLPYTYKWVDALAMLEAMEEAGEHDPFDGIILEYANPVTGGPTMPTIHCRVQLLPPGEETRPHRHTSSTIYHVISGDGVTTVGPETSGGKNLTWVKRDCFFVPSLDWHAHRNNSKNEPAILFSVTDRPVLESLGLYREEQA
jgi:gentisate 1,2-dioxygenase/1-hydroxy-2-naphthoate dioxygenase